MMAGTSGERRSSRRYQMELPVRYRVLTKQPTTGVGVTRNLSSGGVAFVSDSEIPTGEIIELWVAWPVAEDVRRVELRTAGRVVRSSGAETAIQSRRHAFVTLRKDAESGCAAGSL